MNTDDVQFEPVVLDTETAFIGHAIMNNALTLYSGVYSWAKKPPAISNALKAS